jgi:protein-tyrosine-phosphatase
MFGAGRFDSGTAAGKLGSAFGDGVATVQGVGETMLGGTGEVAGFVLDATGVGAIIGVPTNIVSAGVIIHGSSTATNGIVHLSKSASENSGSSSSAGTQESSADTVHGAQRESMRQEGIPTSQQPDKQVSTKAGRQYTYTVPKKGGGTETKIVTRQHADRNHGPHVEAGRPKSNGQTDPSGRARHSNDKTKVNVKD